MFRVDPITVMCLELTLRTCKRRADFLEPGLLLRSELTYHDTGNMGSIGFRIYGLGYHIMCISSN